jgi:hypothetical protein
MDDHIWRVPIVTGVMASSALLQFAAAVVASVLLRRQSSTLTRFVAVAIVGAPIVGGGIVLRAAVSWIARALQISAHHIDPGPLGYVAPSLFALVVWATGDRLLRGWWTSRAALLFYAWLLVFTAANTINYCQPGWCMTIGFPFAWHFWSDGILEGGPDFTRVLEAIGGIVDLIVFALVAWAVTRTRRP